MDADLRERLAAYHNATPDGPPLAWTPEHVQTRYIEALRIVGKLPIAIMGGSGSAWPSTLIDMAKAFDAEARRTLPWTALDKLQIARADEIEPAVRFASDGPTPDQISRAEEAISWPMRYLQGEPRLADAFSIFCYAKAFRSFEIRPFLAERMRQAQAIAKRQADEINNHSPAHEKARIKRRELARDVNEILKGWLATAEDEEHATMMKREALILLRNWCAEAGVLPIQPKAPHLVVPEFCLHENQVSRGRKRAAALVAKALQKDRAVIR